jgi:hypothetical protein
LVSAACLPADTAKAGARTTLSRPRLGEPCGRSWLDGGRQPPCRSLFFCLSAIVPTSTDAGVENLDAGSPGLLFMRTYRCYLLDAQGHIASSADVIGCLDDDEAGNPVSRRA